MTPAIERPPSLKWSALTAGIGLLIMVFCAPLGNFYFMSQSTVAGDAAATLSQLRDNGTPYVIGVLLLFMTYVMDVVVAWALYWYFRPGQIALSQLVAWSRLVYTAMAFVGLWASLSAYDLANSAAAANLLAEADIQSAVSVQRVMANTMESLALAFFGVHLWLLSVLIWRSSHTPRWLSVPVALAGASYVISFITRYFASDSDFGWLLILALGELVLMVWLLVVGWRKKPAQLSA